MLDWRKGECDLIPGKTAPNIVAVERDYPATYERFTSLGPLMDKLGNGGKGISWNTQDEIDFLGKLNYTKRDGPAQGRPLIDTAIDASEVILALSTTMEGDTTGFYIFRKLSPLGVKVSVIARGVSVGDEIEYADEVTLGRSIINRIGFNESVKV